MTGWPGCRCSGVLPHGPAAHAPDGPCLDVDDTGHPCGCPGYDPPEPTPADGPRFLAADGTVLTRITGSGH